MKAILFLLMVSTAAGAVAQPACPSSTDAASIAARAECSEVLEPDGWWTQLGDPDLAILVQTALAQSSTIEIAAARFDRASATAAAVRASLLPNIGASAGAFETRQSLEDPAIRPFRDLPGFPRTQERYSAGLSASWEVDLFGAAPRRKAARASQQAVLADYQAARVVVAAETATSWLTVRELQVQRQLIAELIAALREQEGMARRRVDAGTALASEVDRLSAERAGQEARLAAFDGAIAVEIERLGVLVGDPSLVRATAARASGTPFSIELPGLESLAISIERRPDVIAAQQRIFAADANLTSAKRSRFPRISLAGLIATIASGPGALFSSLSQSSQFGGAVSLPLLDFGRIDAAIADARGAQREALASARQVTLEAAADVIGAAAVLAARKREEDAQREAVGAIASTLYRVRSSYDAGTVNLDTLLDVERQRINADIGYLSARAEAAKAVVAVLRSAAQAEFR